MKKALLISLIMIVAIGGGVGYLILGGGQETSNQPSIAESKTETIDQQVEQSPPQASTASQPKPGTYVTYSDGIVAATKGTKILFFHAPWCPQCRALEADITSKPLPDEVTIIKVDYDTSQSLRQKYGVTIQTTLVRVDDSGALVKKYVAYDAPTLESLKMNLL